MKLVELLAPERIALPLQARSVEAAVAELADVLIAAGLVSEPSVLRERAMRPEAKDLVMSPNAVLAHFRTDAVPHLAVALGVAPKPILKHTEKKGARVALLAVAPARETSERLQAVGAFSLILSRREVINAVLGARTAADVLAARPLASIELPGFLTVRDVMEHRVLAVTPETKVEEAARIMVEQDVPSLPVVSETKEVLGLVSHRELLRDLLPLHVKRLSNPEFRAEPRGPAAQADPTELPVREVMDRSVLCVSEDQPLAEVATMMLNRNVDRFPVVREGTLIGFLTRGDIVRRLLAP